MTREQKVQYYLLLKERAMRNPQTTFAQFAKATVNFEPHEWQQSVLFPTLERFRHERGLRILMHAPPQYGKSVFASQRLPAWLLGTDPLRRVVLATYNITRSAEFGAVVRDLMLTPEYQEMFPRSVIPSGCGSERFSTSARKELKDGQPSFEALGLQTGFVGRGLKPGDCLIIDDPYASPEDAMSIAVNERTDRFWTQTAITRVDPLANVLCFFHSYHSNDFQARREAEGKWEKIRLPAVADGQGDDPTGRAAGELLSPIRPREYLEAIEENDPVLYWSQFQGKPKSLVDGLFDPNAWVYDDQYDEAGEYRWPKLARWVRYWDLATKAKQSSDYTAGVMMGFAPDGSIYIRDVVRFKANWPIAQQRILEVYWQDLEFCKKHGAVYEAWAEDQAQQGALIDQLNYSTGAFFLPRSHKGDKRQEASMWASRQNAGKVVLAKASWNPAFVGESAVFDGLGLTKDDQIDGASGAYIVQFRDKGRYAKPEHQIIVGSDEYYERLAESYANR